MKKFLTKAISLICVLMLLAAFAPSTLAYTEKTVINWADKTVYTEVTGAFPIGTSVSNKVDLPKENVHSLFGVGESTTKGSGYNVSLHNPGAEAGTTNANRSKFQIDLGAEREINYIELYQWKNRIKTVKVYKLTQAQYNTANNGVFYISNNFINGTKLIGEATFDNETDVSLPLNEIGACNTPDRINLNGTQKAQYLLLVVTEVVPSDDETYQLQKITVNGVGKTGVSVVKNWADANVYTNVKGHNPDFGKGDDSTQMLAALGSKDGTSKDPNYNVYLGSIATANSDVETRSKFAIDLGASRTIDYIDIYQWKNRIKNLQVYQLTRSSYTTAISTNTASISNNFFNTHSPKLLWNGSFDHGTNPEEILNSINACNTPDRIEFNSPVNAQYLLFVVTDVVSNSYKASMLQKITVNSISDTLDAANLELDVELFQNSGSTKNIGVFAAQKNGDMMVDCDIIRTDVANLTQVNLLAQKIAIDSQATSIDFIILDMTTLEPLFKVPYTIEKN